MTTPLPRKQAFASKLNNQGQKEIIEKSFRMYSNSRSTNFEIEAAPVVMTMYSSSVFWVRLGPSRSGHLATPIRTDPEPATHWPLPRFGEDLSNSAVGLAVA